MTPVTVGQVLRYLAEPRAYEDVQTFLGLEGSEAPELLTHLLGARRVRVIHRPRAGTVGPVVDHYFAR